MPGGSHLGRRDKDGNIHHRPDLDVTLSAPKSVSFALVYGARRIAAAHGGAVRRTLTWIEVDAVETKFRDRASGTMIRAVGQDIVAATFRCESLLNLDPQLHTNCVIANMVRGRDGKWRTMVDDGLYYGKMIIGAIYQAALGYKIEKTHADGRFELASVPRGVIDAFSTQCAEIEVVMETHDLVRPGDSPHLTSRVAPMTQAHNRDVGKDALRQEWSRQEVFSHNGLLAATLGRDLDAITTEEAE